MRLRFVETRRRMSMNGWATLLVFLPPALLLFTIFVALPMVEAGWYSFFNWNGFGRPKSLSASRTTSTCPAIRPSPER